MGQNTMAQVLCIFNVSSSCTKTGMRCCLQLGGMVAQLLAKSRLVDPEPVGDPTGCCITRGWVVAAPERCSPARTMGRLEGWEFPGVGFRLPDESDSSRALPLGDIPTRGHWGIARGGSEGSADGAWAMDVCWHGNESSLVPCRAARRRARSPVPLPVAAMSPTWFLLLHLGRFLCCLGLPQSRKQQEHWISLGPLERLIYLCRLFLEMPFHCWLLNSPSIACL